VKRTGLSRSGIYKKMSDGVFPQRIKLGARAAGWLCHEVTGWLNQQIAVSRSTQEM
jgi:prophage regulatory protein